MSLARDNYVLDLAKARQGYALNRMLGSLMDPANRDRFSADEAAYCDDRGLSDEARRAVTGRDYPALLEQGASVFHAFKLTMTDGQKMAHLSAPFTGMSPEDFDAMMRAGGRPPAGDGRRGEKHGGEKRRG